MKIVLLFLVLLFLPLILFSAIGGGDVAFKTEAGDVIFSHDSHVSSYKLVCTLCHDSLYSGAEKRRRVTMKQMEKGESCGFCHNGRTAFPVRESCEMCHKR
jgi:c(7)-type cytochrome triheme protein